MHDTPCAAPGPRLTRAPVAVGLDLGTSSLKGVAIDGDGIVLARSGAGYATDRGTEGRAEQDPGAWMDAVATVVRGLATSVDPARWLAIGLSAMIPTLVAADARLEPIGAAITWEDSRSEAQAEELRERLGGEALYARTGQWLDGRYLLPAWMRLRAAADARAGAAVLAGAKDWLFARLTGTLATDPSTAAGFGCHDLVTGHWDEGILEAALGSGGRRPALPGVRASSWSAGLAPESAVRLGLPAGLPVVLGAADSVLAARALGVTSPGPVAYIAGTSTVIIGVADRVVLDPAHRYLVTPLDRPGAYGLEMDLVATGSAVRWLAGLVAPGGGEAEVWRLAEAVPAGADGLVFLPYLGPGEQGALWDPTLRGTLSGLTLAHGRGHIARALLDGITLESRRCIAVLGEAIGGRGDIGASGAALRSVPVARALADATGRRVRWPADVDHPASAWGAAALALEAVGAGPPAPPAMADGLAPGAGAADAWHALWERHEATRASIDGATRPDDSPARANTGGRA